MIGVGIMHRDTTTDAARDDREQGQTMTEYAVVLSVITLAILLTIQLLGDTNAGLIQQVVDALKRG
jgi:Flp pilus assembly pilin Flp